MMVKCDFCGEPWPRWTLDIDCEGLGVVVVMDDGSTSSPYECTGGWAMCDDCKATLESAGWPALTARSIEAYVRVNGGPLNPLAEQLLRTMHEQVEAHQVLPVRPASQAELAGNS